MKLIKKFKKLSWRKKLLTLLVFALLILGAGFAFGLFDKKEEPPAEPEKFYSQLTGKEVSEELSNRPILGVMIENSQEARPQTGLDSAGIVFETVTEGGITRYLALYQEDMPKEVGPVRSVRPAFVSWLMGFDASVAHVGGSAEALSMIERLNVKTLTQFEHTAPYYRVSSRAAPHNMYASTKKLRDLQKELGHEKSQFGDIPRSDESPAETPTATKIRIDFSSNSIFLAEFRYNKTTNSYARYLGGVPHIDADTEKPITVKNVVVLKISGNHSNNIKTTGKGEAYVFKDGSVLKASWEKTSNTTRIKILDETGNEISLNRGDSWFAGLPAGQSVIY